MKFCPLCATPLASVSIEGSQYMACPEDDCAYVNWKNPTPVVAALVNHNGQYIIARNVKWPRGIYSVITGYLDENETPEQGVIREVKEELNLDVSAVTFVGHYIFKEKNQLIIAFSITATGSLRTNAEIADIKQLTDAELQAYDFNPLYLTSRIVQDWIAARGHGNNQ